MEIFISKNSVFLIFCFFISVHICEGQISKERKLDLDRLAKNSKSQIIVINVPSGQPVSIHSVNGDINRTENGNFYVTNKTEVRNQIIRETARTLQDKNKTIEKVGESVIEAVLKNQDTSINNYRKICEFLKAEIPKNTETDFPLAIEQAYKLLEISKSKKDTFLLANSYALLFFLYSFKDFKDEATPYGEKIDSLLRVNSFNQFTLETFDLYSKGLFLLENYKKVIDVESRALKIRTIHLTPTHESVAKGYSRIARSYRMLQQLDSQNIYYEKALKILDVQNNQKDISYNREVYRALYYFKYKNLNDWNTSDKLFRKAIKVDIQLKDSILLADDYCDLGVVYDRKKMADSAIFYYKLAIEIRSKVKKYTLKQNKLENYNLGCTYFDQLKYDSSNIYFSRALKGYENDTGVEEQKNINWAKYCIGIRGDNSRSEECIILINQVLQYYKIKWGNTEGWEVRNLYLSMGKRFNYIGDYDKARKYLDTTIFLTLKYDHKNQFLHHYYWERSFSYNKKGDLIRALKDIDTAIYYYHNQSSHNKYDLVSLLNIQSDYYSRLGYFKQAINCYMIILELASADSQLYKTHYQNTLNSITYYSYQFGDSVKSTFYLLKSKEYLEANPNDTYTNIRYRNCAINAEMLKNYPLALYFLSKEKDVIMKIYKNQSNIKYDLLFQNELMAVIITQKMNKDYNVWDQLLQLEKSLKKSTTKYYDNRVDIYFEKIMCYLNFNPNDLNGLVKISNEWKNFMEVNKNKISYDQLLKGKLMLATIEIPLLLNEKKCTNAKAEIYKLISDLKVIAQGRNQIEIQTLKQTFLSFAEIILDRKEKEDFINFIQNI